MVAVPPGDAPRKRARAAPARRTAAILGSAMRAGVYHVRVPAQAACLHAIRAFVGSVLARHSGELTHGLVLALDEACANAIKHRPRSRGCDELDLRIEVRPTVVRFRIGCFCARKDLQRMRARAATGRDACGLGVRLIGSIMDRVDFEPDPSARGRLVLVLEKRLRSRRP